MIRSVVKNIYLSILKIDDKDLRKFMTAFPNNIYFPNIIFQLRNIIMKLCLINFLEDNSKSNPIDKFRDEHDILVDHMFYISDLLLIGLDNVNFILINCILNEIILPLLKVIISKKEEKVSIVFALYILILFIYIVKNKFINDVISYLLFEENVSKNLLDKIKEFEFKLINENIMKNVNSIIIHNQFADVNDIEWKTISRYMQEVTGTDLSVSQLTMRSSASPEMPSAQRSTSSASVVSTMPFRSASPGRIRSANLATRSVYSIHSRSASGSSETAEPSAANQPVNSAPSAGYAAANSVTIGLYA